MAGPTPAARFIRLALIVGAAVLLAFIVATAWVSPTRVVLGYTAHALGPIGPADRDMLYRVKQAGLWEMPVGMEAMERAATPEFREVGRRIMEEHTELDRQVEEVARRLDVALPAEVTPDQADWMRDITAAQGLTYDQRAVFLLRRAHGQILPALAQVRAGTRNSAVRAFADVSIQYVNRHMGYLDSTGLVDFTALPESPAPSTYQQPAVASYWTTRDPRTLVVAGIALAAAVALLVAVARSMRGTPALRSPPKTPARHSKKGRTP